MVADGYAWHYKAYSKDAELATAEQDARTNRNGLWGGSGKPIAPWDFRHGSSHPQTKSLGQNVATARTLFAETKGYWIAKNSGVIHNPTCRYYQVSKGFPSRDGSEGTKNCKMCGGTTGR
jgi:hypothetical protein